MSKKYAKKLEEGNSNQILSLARQQSDINYIYIIYVVEDILMLMQKKVIDKQFYTATFRSSLGQNNIVNGFVQKTFNYHIRLHVREHVKKHLYEVTRVNY